MEKSEGEIERINMESEPTWARLHELIAFSENEFLADHDKPKEKNENSSDS